MPLTRARGLQTRFLRPHTVVRHASMFAEPQWGPACGARPRRGPRLHVRGAPVGPRLRARWAPADCPLARSRGPAIARPQRGPACALAELPPGSPLAPSRGPAIARPRRGPACALGGPRRGARWRARRTPAGSGALARPRGQKRAGMSARVLHSHGIRGAAQGGSSQAVHGWPRQFLQRRKPLI